MEALAPRHIDQRTSSDAPDLSRRQRRAPAQVAGGVPCMQPPTMGTSPERHPHAMRCAVVGRLARAVRVPSPRAV
ncbi:Hypothetical protein A7982_03726 [Minicystis rosea]|nr:Hypothetical protein A7982_03724 [Minicystis rosea]APR78379.1 Hypothetical protein A7982_03726 [Minicystis rosea]